MDSLYTEEVFTLVFDLVDKLLLSRNSLVHKFLRRFSVILIQIFADENHHKKMLRQLVDHAVSDASDCSETSIDVLVFLVHKACKVERLVLSMIVDDFRRANSDRSALQILLHAREDENIRIKEELQTELSKMRIENGTLFERLDMSEVDNLHYKSEIRLERDRSAQVKFLQQEQAAKQEFQHVYSKQKDKLVKFSQEEKVYQDNINDLNMQLSELKSQNNQELKKVTEEKNVLAERLRNAEAERKKIDEEMRRCSCQVGAQEAAQKSLLNEIQQLKQNLGQVRTEMEEREDEIANYKTCNEALNVRLNYYQRTYAYTERDVAVYALGVGACGRDAVDTDELKYVYHGKGQQLIKVLPTFSTLFSLGSLPDGANLPGLKFDPRLLLHGQQYIEVYKPLPSNATIQNKVSLAGFRDKGLYSLQRILSTNLKWLFRTSIFLRGAGGFSDPSRPFTYLNYPADQVPPMNIPESQPFAVFEDCTQPSQALLYRLSGDYNPLHSDPMLAKVAGFSRPILHGLCTLGFAVRAIIKCICSGDPDKIKNISGRFLFHVYPGETLVTEMWLEGLRFDKIITKEIPSSIVYEDDKVLAFKDINPQAPVHVLVIPKVRDGLTQLGKAEPRHKDILGQLLYAARIVAEKEGILDGFRVVINNGPSACQSVYHIHLHVLGGRQMSWPPG